MIFFVTADDFTGCNKFFFTLKKWTKIDSIYAQNGDEVTPFCSLLQEHASPQRPCSRCLCACGPNASLLK